MQNRKRSRYFIAPAYAFIDQIAWSMITVLNEQVYQFRRIEAGKICVRISGQDRRIIHINSRIDY
jgi:hypothetical protein